MSSTRYKKPGSDQFDAPERYMSDPKLAGINVGIRYIGAVAPVRTVAQTRAAVWLFNYARLSQSTADCLAARMGMSQIELRDCLNSPHAEAEQLERFMTAVRELRAEFESKLPVLAETSVSKRVRRGMKEAIFHREFSLIIGAYRIGKTAPFRDEFFRHYMDRGIYFDAPPGGDMRCLTSAFAGSLGIAVNSSKKNEVINEQILAALATGVIEIICVSEAQYLWPRDKKKFPEKINFFRHVRDKLDFFRAGRVAIDKRGGIGFAFEATPQFADDLNEALAGPWAAGQFEGRIRRNFCPDTLTEDEISAVARVMAPEFDADSRRKLVAVTMASPGLLGFLDNVIGHVRFMAAADGLTITPELVKLAAQEMLRGTETEKKAKEKAAKAAKKAAGVQVLEGGQAA